MGTPMSTHLHNAGYRVTLHDRSKAAARQLAKSLGGTARAVATPREVAAESDIVITMLPNGQVVQDVVFGKDGLSAGFKAGALLLDTSSAEPWLTQDTAARLSTQGVAMVDAPVSGAQWGAQEANLVFMVGAAKTHLARARPLLDVMGRAVFHVGPPGAGHAMKCLNNLITAVTFGATMEGLAVGKAYGLDPAAMVDVLNESTGQSWISRNHISQRVVSRSFDDPFKLELMLKDMGIATALARETATPVPLSGLSHQLWQAASRAAGPRSPTISTRRTRGACCRWRRGSCSWAWGPRRTQPGSRRRDCARTASTRSPSSRAATCSRRPTATPSWSPSPRAAARARRAPR